MITRLFFFHHLARFFLRCCIILCFSFTAHAVEFNLTTNLDAIDINIGDGLCETSGGQCSLRAAVQESNASPDQDIIIMPTGTYSLTVGSKNEDEAEQGDLDILDDLVIRGAGASGSIQTLITGNNAFRLFSVLVSDEKDIPTVVIEDLAMTRGLRAESGGLLYTEGPVTLNRVLVVDAGLKSSAVHADKTHLTVTDSVFEGNSTSIYSTQSRLKISDSVFKNKEPTSGVSVQLAGFSVGNIEGTDFIDNKSATESAAISANSSRALITNSRFTNNETERGNAGAISLFSGTYSLKNNRFTGNLAGRNGAGALYSNAVMYIDNTVFFGNSTTDDGGAIKLANGKASITDSLFESNNAGSDCGAVFTTRFLNTGDAFKFENVSFRDNTAAGNGGAICMTKNTLVSHSEFSANTAGVSGGAVYSIGDESSIENSTLSQNKAVFGAALYRKAAADDGLNLTHLTVHNNQSIAGGNASVVNESGQIYITASNISGTGTDQACEGLITSFNHNLVSDTSCDLTGVSDTVETNSLLGELVVYGRDASEHATRAHIPLPGSPLVQAVPVDNCLLVDQAYKDRAGERCDIGAAQLGGEQASSGIVQFDKPEYTVSERAGSAEISVTRTQGARGEISVEYFDSGQGTVSGSDYRLAETKPLFWADGDVKDKIVKITISNDFLEEGTETVQFSLVGPGGGAVIGFNESTALSIIDDETSLSVFAFEASMASVSESDRQITISVKRTVDSVGVANVDFTTADGTALAGEDYFSKSGTLRFDSGDTAKDLSITIADDDELEIDESFSIVLDNPTNSASLGGIKEIIITIKGNDNAAPDTTSGPVGETTSNTTVGNNEQPPSGGTPDSGTSSGATSGATSGESGSTSGDLTTTGGSPGANDDPEPATPSPTPQLGSGGGGGSAGALFAFIVSLCCYFRRKQWAV